MSNHFNHFNVAAGKSGTESNYFIPQDILNSFLIISISISVKQ